MIKPSCKTCLSYVANPLQMGVGTCRYNAPTLHILQAPTGVSFLGDFPPVREDLWCRKWEKQSNALDS